MIPIRANPISSIAQVDGSGTAQTSLLASVVVSVCVALSLVDQPQTIRNHFFCRSDLCDERCSNLLVKCP